MEGKKASETFETFTSHNAPGRRLQAVVWPCSLERVNQLQVRGQRNEKWQPRDEARLLFFVVTL